LITQEIVLYENVRKALVDDVATTEFISKLYGLEDKYKLRLVGRTHVVVYRRVHEILTAVCSRVEYGVEHSEPIDKIELLNIRNLVFMNTVRDVLSRDILAILVVIIDTLLDKQEATIATRAKMILDAVASLVYEYGSKH